MYQEIKTIYCHGSHAIGHLSLANNYDGKCMSDKHLKTNKSKTVLIQMDTIQDLDVNSFITK